MESNGTIAGVFEDRRLALAPSAGSTRLPDAAGFVCALDGHVHNAGAVADSIGVPRDAGLTATLVAGYRALGPEELLDRLRGDFALVLWDPVARRGLLARDQLGGRSMFLHDSGRRVLFASELRDLLRALPARPAPDAVAVVHWLAMSAPPRDRTFYDGVRPLEPGHCALLEEGRLRTVRYWTPRYTRPERIDRGEAADRIRAALVRSVVRRRGDDVAGVMLSGGIDSAAVAAIAAHCDRERPPRAYSAVFPRHPAVDESALIHRLTSELHLPSYALEVPGGSVLAGAVDYLRTWEVPAVSPNLFFWKPLLRRAAADGVTVMLDGEGGDALFWLSPYLLADRLRRGRLRSAIALAHLFPGATGQVDRRTIARQVREWGARGALPHSLHALRRRVRGPAAFTPAWFTTASARLYFETDDEIAWKRTRAPRWWAWVLESVTGLGSGLMHETVRRRNSEVGIEARHPLLDVDLIELLLSLPPELSFDVSVSRPLLRESVRGLMPEEIRMRPAKSSFDALFHESLATRDLPAAQRLLTAHDAEVNAYVDPQRMRTLLFDSGPPRTPGALQAWALDVWRLVTAELWLRSSSGRPIDFFPPATVRKLTYDGRVAGGEAANHLSEPKDGTRCVTKNHSSTTTAHSSS